MAGELAEDELLQEVVDDLAEGAGE